MICKTPIPFCVGPTIITALRFHVGSTFIGDRVKDFDIGVDIESEILDIGNWVLDPIKGTAYLARFKRGTSLVRGGY